MPDVFAGLPITDVDVAEFAGGDFAAITSQCMRVASGIDGAIPAASFALTSATPFDVRAVQVGHVLVLDKYAGTNAQGRAIQIEAGDLLPVASVSGTTVTLKRFGDAPGDLPKGVSMTSGATGISYYIPTVSRKIQTEYEIARREVGIVTSADLINPTDLNRLVILRVIFSLCVEQSRTAGDPWSAKADRYLAWIKDELLELRRIYSEDTTQSMRPVSGRLVDDVCWADRVPSNGGLGLSRRAPGLPFGGLY